MTQTSPAKPARRHSGLYWFFHHSATGLKSFVQRRRRLFIILFLSTIMMLFFLRAFIHPLVIWFRIHIFILTLGLPIGALLWIFVRRRDWRIKTALFAAVVAVVMAGFFFEMKPHEYMSLYLRYRTLKRVELKELPLTSRDRIQPQNSIASLANEAIVETETPADPHFVRLDDSLHWTLGVEPTYTVPRLTQGVKAILSVSGTAPSPDFSRGKIAVDFETGEHLFLWHNTQLNVIRSFGLIRFLNYQPGHVKYIKDDSGEWVQIVPLVRWHGWFFPRPEFGGVQTIRQRKHSGSFASVKRMLYGVGSWVRARDVQKQRFLQGQNLLPPVVARTAANSFRFQSGFFAPFPGYHLGDIRIPDLPADVNDQPFTIFMQHPGGETPAMLYAYFGLEPFHEEKQGLNTSLFLPSDGTPIVYVYSHHKHNEALAGVSAIAPKVMESRKQYDWSRNKPVEHRPYIKKIAGRTRFFWLTTVVTLKDGETGSFIAGSVPDVVLTDAAYKVVTWMDPLKPNDWDQKLEQEMSEVWKP